MNGDALSAGPSPQSRLAQRFERELAQEELSHSKTKAGPAAEPKERNGGVDGVGATRSLGSSEPMQIAGGKASSSPLAATGGSTNIAWPDPPKPQAFYGLAGELVRAAEPHSEADPVALLTQFLVGFGNVVGRGPHFVVEDDRHALNLNLVEVGVTSKGRKGMSWGRIKAMLKRVDPGWVHNKIISGLSSGEGLIWQVRDSPDAEEGEEGDPFEPGDVGVADKRLLVFEGEFSSVLKVAARQGNTLSATLRQAWDSGDLRILTKNSPARATGAHISIVGHITRDELRRHLDSTEMANGFANRFMWVCVRRSKYLPDDEQRTVPVEKLDSLAEEVRAAAKFAGSVNEMRKDENAKTDWRAIYQKLSDGKPGLLGAITSRAEAQVMRLGCIYALLDRSPTIRREHLRAALALWGYAEHSARYIFGDALGDPTADAILSALRSSLGGLTRTEISGLFKRHKAEPEITRALTCLVENGLARFTKEQTSGRSVERWLAS